MNIKTEAHNQPQSQPQQENASYNAFPANTSYGNPFSFQNPDPNDTAMNSWMTEIDTAIDGYDIYCDRLSNAAMAGMGGMSTSSDANMQGFVNADGTQIGTGVQDWDWGLML